MGVAVIQRNVLEAKNDLSGLIRMLEEGEEDRVIIARRGRPVVVMIRYEEPPATKRIGVAEGRRLVADGWDDDDINDEVAGLFLEGA